MRKPSTSKYIIALILTIVVFSIGILIGTNLENARLQDAKQITLEEKLNLQSLQLQQKYIESGLADCKALNTIIEGNIDELSKKGATIIQYQQDSFFREDEFQPQLRDYFLTEIQFYFIAKEIDEKCRQDSVKVIYFYDEDSTDTQGVILDYLKKRFTDDLMIFSFNSKFEEPMINILLESYNITQFPSVVVGEEVFYGHTDVRTLRKSICNNLINANISHTECVNAS